MPYRNFDQKELENIFTYHSPDDEQQKAYAAVNGFFLDCALECVKVTPDGPGKTVAIRKLNEARNAFNSAIALRGEF